MDDKSGGKRPGNRILGGEPAPRGPRVVARRAVVGSALTVVTAHLVPAISRAESGGVPDYLPEGSITVYSNIDLRVASELIRQFRAVYPKVGVNYVRQLSDQVYERFLEDVTGKRPTADVVWSSAMDLQAKLINDRYAEPYEPPEAFALPDWAKWAGQAYGVTAEPAVIVYNKGLMGTTAPPQNHAELRLFLNHQADRLAGKIAAHDPEQSGTGLLLLTQDVQVTPLTWDLVAAIGRTSPRLFSSSSPMLEGLSSGDLLLAYNVVGSYARERAQADPNLGIVVPNDYALILSRIAFVPVAAARPDLGKVFLNFLLSQRGQKIIAAQYLGSVRRDVPSGWEPLTTDAENARPIRAGPELLTYLDRAKRASFIRQWRRAVQTR